MSKKSAYIVFLNNRYDKEDSPFYLKRLRGKTTIAADGGIRFFKMNKIKPDILIGDFDSSPRLAKEYLEEIEVINYPVRKNKTDSQLAVELAVERGAKSIEICGALSTDEIDHTLCNIFLLKLLKSMAKKHRRRIEARIVTPDSTIILLENETRIIEGIRGDYFSVIPLTGGGRVGYAGMAYPPPPGALQVGDSFPLRNRLMKRRTEVTAKGAMLVVIGSGAKKS